MDMQNIRHIAENAGNSTQNDGRTMSATTNEEYTTHFLFKTLVSRNDFQDIWNKKNLETRVVGVCFRKCVKAAFARTFVMI